jgi:hypothetical protein
MALNEQLVAVRVISYPHHAPLCVLFHVKSADILIAYLFSCASSGIKNERKEETIQQKDDDG